MGVRRKNDIDIIKLIKNSKVVCDLDIPQNLNDIWPGIHSRIIAMFFFSKEHGFLESRSLKKIDAWMTLDELLDYQPTLEKILKRYQCC